MVYRIGTRAKLSRRGGLQWLSLQVLMLCASAQVFRYVKPDISSALTCPGQPCFTLGQFAGMQDEHFTIGSTFVFLAGNYSLQTVLRLAGVSDITLRGDGNGSTASVYLGNDATIICDNVTNVRIEGLQFILCKYQCKHESVLHFIDSGEVTISNCDFLGYGQETLARVRSVYSQHSNITIMNCFFKGNSGSSGGAIEHSGEGIVTINESTFARNINKEAHGGAVSISGGKLILSGNVIFSKNEAFLGGAVMMHTSDLSCDRATTVVLDGNRAEYGGGMHVTLSSVRTRWCSLNFINNFAKQGGGGWNNVGNFIAGDTNIDSVLSGNFVNNSARLGSAMFIQNKRNITFMYTNITGNLGNALSISASTITFHKTRILNNVEEKFGGGIYSSDSNLLFENYNLLGDNKAHSGGAMYLLQGTVSFDGTTLFMHNSASGDGGALYAVGTVIK